MTTEIKAFEVGKSYWTRSICDYDCIIRMTVVSRTAKFITAEVGGKTKRLGVKVCSYDNAERCDPWGRYSMSPVISADRQG